MGIDSNQSDPYRGYGAVSFCTLSSLQTIHGYYLNYATLAANLLAETAHATVDGVDPGGANLARSIRAAQLQMLGTSDGTPGLAARRKQVKHWLPPLITTGSVFIDRQYGLMWCTSSVGGLTSNRPPLWPGPFRSGATAVGDCPTPLNMTSSTPGSMPVGAIAPPPSGVV